LFKKKSDPFSDPNLEPDLEGLALEQKVPDPSGPDPQHSTSGHRRFYYDLLGSSFSYMNFSKQEFSGSAFPMLIRIRIQPIKARGFGSETLKNGKQKKNY
jgi:hypothetical protein